jgi:hypothetical protein
MAGTAAPDSGGAGTASGKDAATEAAVDDGSSIKCTVATDPGNGKSCGDVCSVYFKSCTTIAATMSTYANLTACVTACKALTQTQLCCRALHAATIAGAANPNMDYLNMHCPHIIGMAPCT